MACKKLYMASENEKCMASLTSVAKRADNMRAMNIRQPHEADCLKLMCPFQHACNDSVCNSAACICGVASRVIYWGGHLLSSVPYSLQSSSVPKSFWGEAAAGVAMEMAIVKRCFVSGPWH